MNVHEYQAKELFFKYGINVPVGKVATTEEEARQVGEDLNAEKVVIKAQIHSGGRGKAGGVKVVDSVDDIARKSADMLGLNIVTPQTGKAGKLVRKVLIEEASDIVNEFYLGMVIDRSKEQIVVMASPEGGTDIEEVARNMPDQILKIHIDPSVGIYPYQCRKIAYFLDLKGKVVNKLLSIVTGLYDLFTEKDCSLAEINPLVLTGNDELLALDGKLNFDDNAIFRHRDIAKLHDPSEENRLELEAKEVGISFVKLDGNIGCLVNGAGLAMATMDIIKLHGGEPANFLDVGGGANEEQVTKAFKMILSDDNVKAVFVNIFGGIMKCDTIAKGIISAVREISINVPLIIRLEGTNVEKGKEMLSSSGLNIQTGNNMKDAAHKVVKAANG